MPRHYHVFVQKFILFLSIKRAVQRRSVFLYEVVLLDLSGNSTLVSKFKNWANLIF